MTRIAYADVDASRPVTPVVGTPRPWQGRLAGAVALTLLGVIACADAWLDMLLIAKMDEEASHLWLVPLVAAWLVFSRKEVLPATPLRSTLLGPAIVLLGGVMNWYGFYYFTQAAWHGGAVLVAIGCFLTLMGWRLAWQLLPAFAVLLFLVPVPGMIRQEIAIPLQSISATITRFLYELVGLTITQTGNQLHFNGQPILIAEACNGMRMVFALLLVSYAIAFSAPYRLPVRILLILLSPLLAIVCNVIRLVPTVYLYGQSQEWGDLFHTVSGWAMVVVAYVLVMGVLGALRWLDVPLERSGGDAAGEMVAAPEAARVPSQSGGRALPPAVLAVAAVGLIGALGLQRPRAADATPYHAVTAAAMAESPRNIGDWIGRDDPLPPAAVMLLRPNATVSRMYTNLATGETVHFVIVQTRDARDMIGHYPPNCYPNAGWIAAGQEPHVWRAGDLEIPGTLYAFRFDTPQGAARRVVANFLLLPDGRFPQSMGEVVEMSSDHTKRFFGAAQVQLLIDQSVEPARRDAIVEELLTAHRPIIDAIRSGHE